MQISTITPLATNHALATPTTKSAATQPSADSSVSSLANQNTFLQLLVAQLRNQDPLNPQDGTQFVSQLAQLSELQQVVSINQSVSTMATDLGSRNVSKTG